MFEDDDRDRTGQPHSSAYEAPGVSWEEPFEVKANLASACGKIDGGPTAECMTSGAS
jgi:hypothetical protein